MYASVEAMLPIATTRTGRSQFQMPLMVAHLGLEHFEICEGKVVKESSKRLVAFDAR
jgi:hypothetical protein